MVAQPYEYTTTSELHTLKELILWYLNYISIFKSSNWFLKQSFREEPPDPPDENGGGRQDRIGRNARQNSNEVEIFVFKRSVY